MKFFVLGKRSVVGDTDLRTDAVIRKADDRKNRFWPVAFTMLIAMISGWLFVNDDFLQGYTNLFSYIFIIAIVLFLVFLSRVLVAEMHDSISRHYGQDNDEPSH